MTLPDRNRHRLSRSVSSLVPQQRAKSATSNFKCKRRNQKNSLNPSASISGNDALMAVADDIFPLTEKCLR